MKYCKNGEVRFNLVSKEGTKLSQIWMLYSFDGVRLRYYTGKRINSSLWDPLKQRVKSQADGAGKINDLISKMARIVLDTYTDNKILGIETTVSSLKFELKNHAGTTPKSSFLTEFDAFIEQSKLTRSLGTIKQYTNTRNHLKEFSEKKGVSLSFENITPDFFQSFVNFLLYDQKHYNNTVHRVLKNLKVFLNFASELGLNNKTDYKKFRFSEKYGDVIFLTWDELMTLYNKEFDNETYSKVRDIFCFECFTSLRYSDILKLTPGNIVDDFIQVNVTKKREKKILTIPLIPQAKAILEKYSDPESKKLLPCMSNQKMNTYLKTIGEKAEINTPVILIKYKGAERTEEIVPKHQVLTTHVGRKTFITNFLAKGVSAQVLMSITDHNSDRPFRRYYKILDDHKKKELLNALNHG
jgi:integrase